MGGFYSEVENEFLPGLALWTDETVEQYKKTIKHPVQRTLWTSSQSHKEKMEMLNIDISGSIEVDIGTGKKITASGSFLYLDETDVSIKKTWDCLGCPTLVKILALYLSFFKASHKG